MTAGSIIERLGGISFVASHFGLSEKAVWQWQHRGRIPGKYHLALLQMAHERGADLSADDLMTATQCVEAA